MTEALSFRADDYVVADMHPGADDGIAPDPHIVPDHNLFPVLIAGAAGDGMDRMPGGVDCHIGGQLAVVANPDFRHVQKRAVVVGEEVLPHPDVLSIVAIEGRVDEGLLRFPQKLLHRLRDSREVSPIHEVQPL